MQPETYVVDDARAGVTLAACVRSMRAGLSWNQARALCSRGVVRVNGEVARDDARRLAKGDEVSIDERSPGRAPKDEKEITRSEIVFVDRDVVVVRKPKGMMTVPFEDGDKDTLVDRVRIALKRMAPRGGHRYDPELGVVHRIDKDTTGLLVFTRTLAAKRHLQQQFRVHSVQRRYVALVHGHARTSSVDTILMRDRGDGLRGSYGVFRAPRGPAPHDAQRAITHVELLERFTDASLVSCRLETGRQHQIRIHLSEAGHPLIGEKVYVRDFDGEVIPAERPMLHAETLGFVHPRSEEEVRFSDPPPEDFMAKMEELRRR